MIVAASITPTTTKTFLFTTPQANQAFPLPFGFGGAAPYAGQVFRFTMGGLIATPASAATLVIDPFHGPGTAQSPAAGGTDMTSGPAQTVAASLTNIPWRMEGELIYRTISAAATVSTAWLTGMFSTQGTLATAGSGCSVPFGSTAAVSVDTTGGGTLGTYGALNFAFTFSVTGATISAQWTSMQSLN